MTLWNMPHGGHVRYGEDAVTPAAYVHRMQKSGRELVLKISSFGYYVLNIRSCRCRVK
ncbi:unnamed protein product [Brassica oleracea var. botrytis]|uniref:Uncharacterized protein n=1 Tax=Brassica oleracea TaxID=3712 RepID=A0A3P6D4H8_BRAOL|nr:unnamed protein product [Brassica oleracea]